MEKIKNVMLGHCPKNISLVIMTPLKSTFVRLKDVLDIEETYTNAFFENCVFRIKKENKRGMLILSPQGIASKDIIELFDDTDFLFFGLAGSLNTKIKIGDFVEVKTVIDEEKRNIPLVTTEEYETVRCGYSPCMLGSVADKYTQFAKSEKCDVIDMETVYCAKTAIERNNRFTSLLLISDIPNVTNFWELTDQTQDNLKKCRKIAIDKIISYIEN